MTLNREKSLEAAVIESQHSQTVVRPPLCSVLVIAAAAMLWLLLSAAVSASSSPSPSPPSPSSVRPSRPSSRLSSSGSAATALSKVTTYCVARSLARSLACTYDTTLRTAPSPQSAKSAASVERGEGGRAREEDTHAHRGCLSCSHHTRLFKRGCERGLLKSSTCKT